MKSAIVMVPMMNVFDDRCLRNIGGEAAIIANVAVVWILRMFDYPGTIKVYMNFDMRPGSASWTRCSKGI